MAENFFLTQKRNLREKVPFYLYAQETRCNAYKIKGALHHTEPHLS